MRVNFWLIAAAALSFVTAGVHVLMGGPEVMAPVLAAENLALPVRSVSYVVWHGMTVVMLLTSSLLAIAAFKPGWAGRMLWLPLAQYALFAALFVVVTLKDFGELLALPQWIAFASIVVVTAIGLRQRA